MLDKLFISKVRIKMLKQYLYNRGESYHVRALVRELDEEINAVRRELQNLENIGLLSSQKRGNRLVYTMVDTFPLIPELYALLRKNEPEIRKITKEISKLSDVSVALITENYFSGESSEKTDVDLLIVSEAQVKELNVAIKSFEEITGRQLRVAAIKTSEIPFYVKKRDPLLLSVLRKDRITLIGSDKDLYRYE